MKKLTFTIAAAALVSLGTIGAAAHAQTFGPSVRAQVFIGQPAPIQYHGNDYRRPVPPPPPRYYGHSRYDHHDRYDRYDRHGYRDQRGYQARADNDRDGVPNRYDRAPNNPYRR